MDTHNTAPRHTGRHLLLLRDGVGRTGVQTLQTVAGLRIGVSSDFEGTVRTAHLALGEGMLFERLGVALVNSPPDQMTALGVSSAAAILATEPERFVYTTTAKSRAAPSAAGSKSSRSGRKGSAARVRLAPDGQPPGPTPIVETEATWGLQLTNVLSSTYSGNGIRLAVLDTGLDLQHPDFAGRTIVSQSFVTGVPVIDGHGHGTHCVGVACGPRKPAQLPRYGIASAAAIYVGKVLGDDGGGSDGNILAGMDWALRSGCAVISMSLGAPVDPGQPYSQVFEQVAQRALAGGTLIVAAAGNDSLRPGSIAPVDHPANCPSIMAVGAVDNNLQVASFSCGGINPGGGEVDIVGPGVAVISAWPRPTLYQSESGTSMATPHVAGIAALFAEANPAVRATALRALLLHAALPLPFSVRDVGAGLVRAP
jgi:subtilisin